MAEPTVFLSGWRDPGDAASVDAALRKPGARVVAVDPLSYMDAAVASSRVEAAGSGLPSSSLASLDAAEVVRLRGLETQGPEESLTRRPLGYLMARSILFRTIPFAKSLAVAESTLPDASSLTLVGESATPRSFTYPSEFPDLYEILETLARHDGLACERLARPKPSDNLQPPSRSLVAVVARIQASLLRIRPRRVLAVEAYQGIREALSRLLSGVTIIPFVAPAPSRRDRESALRLSKEFRDDLPKPAARDSLPEVEALRTQAIQQAIVGDLPRVLSRARTMARLLRSFHPQVVLLMEDASPSGRALAALARGSGAWTVVIQHGLIGEDLGGTHVMPCVANVQCDWGTYAADWNYAHGAPPESQIVIGNPMLDRSHPQGWAPPDEVVPREVVFVSQPYVGLSTLESDFHRMETIRALLPFEAEGVPVVVRPHPSDDLPSLRRLVSGLGFVRAQWDATVEQSLARPAVIVTKTSTVALEAMLRGRPVVLAVLSGRGDRTGLSDHGAALLATTPAEVTAQVRSGLTNPTIRQQLSEGQVQLFREYLDGMDGHAVNRLAEHVLSHFPARAR